MVGHGGSWVPAHQHDVSRRAVPRVRVLELEHRDETLGGQNRVEDGDLVIGLGLGLGLG